MFSRQALFTLLALVAFAANSVLARLALADGSIDPLGFTALRIAAGGLVLLPFLRRGSGPLFPRSPEKLRGAAALLIYAGGFSLAYLSLTAATGALILFGAVQATMFGAALMRGERPGLFGWLGLMVAGAGLVWLLAPGVSAPDPLGAALMTVSGLAWGGYTLLGKGATDPAGTTARNFALASLPALVVLAVKASTSGFGEWTGEGIALALLSGALASGAGYLVWYAALRSLGTVQASVAQLSVPVLAALGGAALIAEPITLKLTLSSALVLGGIGLTLVRGERRASVRA
ncbi:DMT family transporter [Parvularcula maris]|uniref:DMT family transporter n=1 Tax=Parvularcula maris TaxID=2965077 RepID=A0A9X2RGW8_9PROT|nr:DMT family transporter [Parvularcula maris]MCQ8184274.1 DMT family transporter [Parvularcula maris]